MTTAYPGATQEVMQGFVTTPISQAIATANGIEYLTSTSSQGVSTVSAKLVLNANADRSMTEILARVQQVKYQLPPGATDPVISKITDGVAAIEGIPEDLHEAATLDGANGLQRLRYVIIPMIRPVLVSISVIQVIFSLKVFDLVWVMTKGGPAESSAVLGTYLYRKAFEQQDYGYASAVAVAMFAVIFTVTYLYNRLMKVEAVEY